MSGKIAGYMFVHYVPDPKPDFERLELRPDPMAPRFKTREEADARKESYYTWNRKSNWSLFDGSIPYYCESTDRSKAFVNPEYVAAEWEILIYEVIKT